MTDLVIGMGEIGRAVNDAICPNAETLDKANLPIHGRIEVMHICFPYSETFVHDVQAYMIQHEPEHVIIWSTTQVGTTKKIDKRVVHSPVEGKHPNLSESIKTMKRWIGYNVKHEAVFFNEYFALKKIKTNPVRNTDHTEALKLLSTTEYGINIVFAGYKARIAQSIGMPYELTKEWNEDYNELYNDLELHNFQKFVLDAPEGPIGGHCVVPNATLLDEIYPDTLNKLIKEYGNGEVATEGYFVTYK